MFLALGVVVEKITGKSWEENIKEKLFSPLGMTNTNLTTKEIEKSADHSLAFATKDSLIKVIPYRTIDAIGPAGSINSSATDMAKWLIAWINNGKYDGKEIIPASLQERSHFSANGNRWWIARRRVSRCYMSGYGSGLGDQ